MPVDIKEEHVRLFLRRAKALKALIDEIRKYSPQANYYVSPEGLNLMKGPSHGDGEGEADALDTSANQCNVVETVDMMIDGGDW